MQDFHGKAALITGGASGIGLALARQLRSEGASIILADIEATPLAQAAAELGAKAVRMDVANPDDWARLAADTPHLDFLCLNAGVGSQPAAVWEKPLADWQWLMGVNFWGVLHGIREFVPRMIAQNTEGHILITASIAGFMAFPFGSDYHASKHAVIAVAESLHHELAVYKTKLKASVLCPAFVATRIMDSQRNRADPTPLAEDKLKYFSAFNALCNAGMPPDEIAKLTIEAIRQGKFYILTHPDARPIVEERFNGILNGVNPQFHDGIRTRKLLGLV